VEKPFTVNLAETDKVLECARANGRLVCVGHDQLFDPIWTTLEQQVSTGRLGEIVHIDSTMGYNLEGPFGKMMLSDRNHWLHKLPGGLFHNNISHAIYKVTPFIPDKSPRIWATTDVTAGERPATELRVLIQGEESTATVLFSSRARPVLRCLRVYGTKATVEVDFDGRLLHWYRGSGLPGALGKLHLPWQHLREAARTLASNSWNFIRCRQQYFLGMRRLFTSFYTAIQSEGPPPIEYTEIRRVTAWMDQIFESCRMEECVAQPSLPSIAGAGQIPL
jgi:predicted dehydrogenase